jgi:hypothetical protein
MDPALDLQCLVALVTNTKKSEATYLIFWVLLGWGYWANLAGWPRQVTVAHPMISAIPIGGRRQSAQVIRFYATLEAR